MKRSAVTLALILAGRAGAQPESVVDTPHNLSVTGPGPVRALSEERVCIFCHTPHGSRADAPLWNRFDSTASYQTYDSPTLDAAPGQPSGASKLCLSCHDGTIALGQLISEPVPLAMSGGATTMPPGPGLIGTDLRDDHPISFTPVLDDPALAPPSSWGPMHLDPAGQFQCTTCHDPHDNSLGDFLLLDNTEGAMCQVCHRLPGWAAATHAQVKPLLDTALARGAPGAQPLHVGRIPGGCGVCHVPHGAGRPPLLRGFSAQQLCLDCHAGNHPEAADIASAANLPSGHFVDRHAEEHHRGGESAAEAAGHVTCADCHNVHRSNRRPAGSGLAIGGAMEGVPGLTLGGAEVAEAQFEYEVCLRCHGPYGASTGGFPVRRQIEQFDLSREIDPGNPSYHPVAAPGRNLDVPSLLAPLGPGSIIRCTDCHRGPVGGVPGPHGSVHEWLLAAEHRTGDGVSESPQAYALCYTCHSRTSILADESFPTHRLHVVDERASCAVCHDPHGVSLTQGDPTEHTHLINFDVSVVQPDPVSGRLAFVDLGTRGGQCYLTCHGRAHSPEGY